jgi:hypothetical protein
MSFIKVSVCPRCGAPIWIPEFNPFHSVPPPTIYSCECSAAMKEQSSEIVELKKKIEELEKKLPTIAGRIGQVLKG